MFIHDGNDYGELPRTAVSDTEEDAGETLFDPALLTFRYPYQRETTLPAKLTATQLKGRALDQEIAEDAYHTPYIRPLVQPKFRREKKGLTPAERGTATHLVLQYLDLQNLDVPGQVEKLRLEAKLTAEQAAAVDVPALRRFLESPLAEEMRQAETAAREYRFTVLMPARDYDPAAAEEDSILLQGVVDCWFETPEGAGKGGDTEGAVLPASRENRGNLVISSFFAKTGKNACNLCSDVICLFSFYGVKAP